jgi:hypothetical protein
VVLTAKLAWKSQGLISVKTMVPARMTNAVIRKFFAILTKVYNEN